MVSRRRSSRAVPGRTPRQPGQEKVAQGFAHEIRNPLAAIKAAVDVIRELEALTPEGRRITQEIDGEILRIDRVVRQLLEFVERPQVHLETISASSLIESIGDYLADVPKGFELRNTVPRRLAVQADLGILQKVLSELVQNGIDAGATEVVVRGGTRGRSTWLCLSNNAPKIDRDNIGRVFEPFFSTRPQRAGLGLSIVRRRLGVLGGTITVVAARDGFEITLPTRK